MTRKLHRIALATAAVAALGASTLTAAASADSAPAKHSRTLTVCVKSAYIDAPAPGKLFVGTIFKGEHFHVDRSARIKSGSAKGLWHHGKRIATGKKGTYAVTGWVKEASGDKAVFKCACHNSEYDPRQSAKVLFGPAPRRLAALPLAISDGALTVAVPFVGKVGA